MEITKTNIDGVLVVTPQVYKDSRGYFMESFNLNEFREKSGLNDITFVQDNESFSKYNTLRGLHFQTGDFAQAKLVRVTQGSVFDVAVDIREGSPTYGKWFGIELSEYNNQQLFIPRGCAHGFYVTSRDGAKFQYKCDNYYNKDSEGGIIWNDKDINIEWPIVKFDHEWLFISDKDMLWKTLNNKNEED